MSLHSLRSAADSQAEGLIFLSRKETGSRGHGPFLCGDRKFYLHSSFSGSQIRGYYIPGSVRGPNESHG